MKRIKTKDYFLVTIQFVLLIAYCIVFYKTANNTNIILRIAGIVTSASGFIVAIVAMITLNRNLRAVPTPVENGTLITHGIFSIVRHPIYTGILLVAFGGLVIHFSFALLSIAIALFILFSIKSSYEERMLSEKYNGYKDYRLKTGKLFPFIK
ncbi:MAG: isoprenylcysteine carboxylmethyltransferase family protein [Bacteroidetes bacterium]|nr:isoprenylcysteine carboxylmethyltransferase family protein [Bacteroidota bacterium]MBP7398066.1 isoprenylcysteine carboxylmethyltransferase family protein [Chitinophagales bacterium]MBK8487923.1 isoprenylcysteine carboxylmethyltransferase family protein [Bacteroidota bacterium]MBP8753176.1 isoprenylcysteine carboxylmethyltransferase family protein [Chitinophagales bacterium]MBP9188168.1 isoprenylcysteine carboxylmethyltransferase family protein [Chitinophagales bacterium]